MIMLLFGHDIKHILIRRKQETELLLRTILIETYLDGENEILEYTGACNKLCHTHDRVDMGFDDEITSPGVGCC